MLILISAVTQHTRYSKIIRDHHITGQQKVNYIFGWFYAIFWSTEQLFKRQFTKYNVSKVWNIICLVQKFNIFKAFFFGYSLLFKSNFRNNFWTHESTEFCSLNEMKNLNFCFKLKFGENAIINHFKIFLTCLINLMIKCGLKPIHIGLNLHSIIINQ